MARWLTGPLKSTLRTICWGHMHAPAYPAPPHAGGGHLNFSSSAEPQITCWTQEIPESKLMPRFPRVTISMNNSHAGTHR